MTSNPRRTTWMTLLMPALLAGPLSRPSFADEPARTALKGLDPVALVRGREVKGLDRLAVSRDGLRYLFADAADKATFEGDPDRYAVQGRGACTVTPSVPASPDLFAVHDGRIYGFASPHCLAAFRKEPAKYLQPAREVVILVYDGVELLDFAGPGEVFTSAGGGRAFRVSTVAASRRPIVSQGFATLTPRFTLADCPRPDVLVIPGGATSGPAADAATTAWIRSASAAADVTLSVCTGSFLLGEAGLLDGRAATTHHASIERLKAAFPKAEVVEGRRFVDSGAIVTSAGVSAGIDASLHVVERLLGRDVAAEAALRIEYPWKPRSQSKPD